MKIYQMFCEGTLAYFEGPMSHYSKDVYSDKSLITEEVKSDFIKRCTTEQFRGDLRVLENDKNLKFKIIELDLIQ